MTKVRTLKKHSNRYEPAGAKRNGRIYEVTDERELQRLIAAGQVEVVKAEAKPKADEG